MASTGTHFNAVELANTLLSYGSTSSSFGITDAENLKIFSFIQKLNIFCNNSETKKTVEEFIAEKLKSMSALSTVKKIFNAVNQCADDANNTLSDNPICLSLYLSLVTCKGYESLKRKTIPYTLAQAIDLLSSPIVSPQDISADNSEEEKHAPNEPRKEVTELKETEESCSFYPTKGYQLDLLENKSELDSRLKQLSIFLKELPPTTEKPEAIVNEKDRDAVKSALILSVLDLEKSGISAKKIEQARHYLEVYTKSASALSRTKKYATEIIEYAETVLKNRPNPAFSAEKYKWLKYYLTTILPSARDDMGMQRLLDLQIEFENATKKFASLVKKAFRPDSHATVIFNQGREQQYNDDKNLFLATVEICKKAMNCIIIAEADDMDIRHELSSFHKMLSAIIEQYDEYAHYMLEDIRAIEPILDICVETNTLLHQLSYMRQNKSHHDEILDKALNQDQKFEHPVPKAWVESYSALVEEAKHKCHSSFSENPLLFSTLRNKKAVSMMHYADLVLKILDAEFKKNMAQTDDAVLFSEPNDWKKFKEALDNLLCQTAIYKKNTSEKGNTTSNFVQQEIINLAITILEAVVRHEEDPQKLLSKVTQNKK